MSDSPRGLRLLLPDFAWLRGLRSSGTLRIDLLAGTTVAIVAIPQALAYAHLAGVPAHVGLYAAFLPAMVAALWGSCPQVSSGPVALTALLVAASLGSVGGAGESYVVLAAALALLSGLAQAAGGLAGAGRFVERLLPAPVVLGFVNAAALMIVASQLPTLLGIAGPREPNLLRTAQALADGLHAVHPPTVTLGLLAVIALWAGRRWAPTFPAALTVAVGATLVSWATGFEASGGQVVGDLPQGLPTLQWPQLEADRWLALVPAALTIALVSFVEVLSSARTISAKTGAHWEVDRELVGQGLGKMASGVFGAFPISGSFSRSALSFAARTRTPLSTIVTVVLVGIALVFATETLHHLPRTVLSAVIVSAVLNLLAPAQFVLAWKTRRVDAMLAIVTLLATLLTAPRIHIGLVVGIVLALVVGRLLPAR